MKKTIIFFLFYIIVFQYSYSIDKSDKIAYSVMSKTTCLLEKKYAMKCIGVKLGGPKKIKLMGLDFQKFNKLSKEECRKLILEISTNFLFNINKSNELSEYLENFPATINDIEIVIFISNDDNSELFYPDIGWVDLIKGKLQFVTIDPTNTFKIKTTETETFQEALDILSSSEKI